MSFFYDLNKKLDGIRATPEVTNKQLNEQASPLTQILNERATGDYSAVKAAAGKDIGKPGKNFSKIAAGAAKRYGSKEAGERVAGAVLNKLRHPKEGMGFLGEKEVDEAHNPNSVDAEHRRSLDASHADNLKKKAAAGDAKAQAALQHLKNKKERMSNDFNAGMERESAGMDESALQAAFGKKKYGDQGMKALQKAGRDNASDSTMNKIRNRYDKYDESQGMTDEGNEFSGELVKARAQHKDSFEVDGKQYPVKEGGVPMTPKQKSFAKLAPPVNKITFADKIVGAKKEVDEMLGDVAAEAMKKALGRGRDQDMEEASTGNAFDYKNFKQPEKQKPTSFVHKGTYGTEYDGDKDDAKAIAAKKKAAVAAGQGSRGRGRPKNNASADTGEVMKPDFSAFGDKVKLKPHTGKITRHKMAVEDDMDPEDQGEYDQEGQMAKDDIKTVVRHAQALEKILGDNDNLPEWVQAKLSKIEGMMTAVDDYMQNQQDDSMDDEQETIDERSVSKAQVKTMGAAAHNPKFAKKVGIKPAVAKEFNQADKGKDNSKLPEKAAKKTKEVDETTSSGSVATSGAAPKAAKGMSYGKGIYDSLNRELEGMISESMSINMSMNNDSHGGPARSITVTATDEDAMALASMLKMAGMGGDDHMAHHAEPEDVKVLDFDDGTDDLAAELSHKLHGGHDSEVCPECGSSDCGCDSEESMDEAYGDTDATENHLDYPTDPEGSDDAMMYSGGIDGPKSTGQSTVPVIASQQDRQHAYEDDAALRRMMEMSGISEAKDNKEQSDKKECPPMSHVKKMCQDGMSTAEICKMHPDCDQTELKQMVADCKEKMGKAAKELNEADAEFNESIQRMREIAGLPVAEAAPPVKLATPQAVDEPVSPASAAVAPGKKPVVKPVTKSATPQAIDDPVAPVKEDQMAQSLMRELHNFKY